MITVKVTDQAGNSETATITLTVNKNVDSSEPVTPPAQEPSEKGCGGSVIASILGVVTLIGATVVLRKRKQD